MKKNQKKLKNREKLIKIKLKNQKIIKKKP